LIPRQGESIPFCAKCGAKLPDDEAGFCPKCGAATGKASVDLGVLI
jgi:predicted amidophosphoribosyltransferase